MRDDLTFTPVVVAVATGLKLFAQQTPEGNVDANIGNLVGNLGIMGVLVWHLWYHTTRTYPEMLKNFREEATSLRQAFQEEQAESRQAFLDEQARMRESFLKEQKESRDHDERIQAELRSLYIATAKEFRMAVHDTRDVAQVAINRQQVVQAQAAQEAQTARDHDRDRDGKKT